MGDWDIIMQCVSLSMQYRLRVENGKVMRNIGPQGDKMKEQRGGVNCKSEYGFHVTALYT